MVINFHLKNLRKCTFFVFKSQSVVCPLFSAPVMPFGRLSVESEEVRKHTVNWQSYVQYVKFLYIFQMLEIFLQICTMQVLIIHVLLLIVLFACT